MMDFNETIDQLTMANSETHPHGHALMSVMLRSDVEEK